MPKVDTFKSYKSLSKDLEHVTKGHLNDMVQAARSCDMTSFIKKIRDLTDALSEAEIFLHKEKQEKLAPTSITPLEHMLSKVVAEGIESFKTLCLCKIK